MIRITRGIVGYSDGGNRIRLTRDSDPVELPKDIEADLVSRGVAEYVGAAPVRHHDNPKPKRKPRQHRRDRVTEIEDTEEPPVIDAAGVE